MSRTCARVLAAALMTGGIAAALALPALVGDAPNVPRAVIAPPSSLQRVVRIHRSAATQRPETKNEAERGSIDRRPPALASLVRRRTLAHHSGNGAKPKAPVATPVADPAKAPTPAPAPAPAPPVSQPAAAPAAAPTQASAPSVTEPQRELASADHHGKSKGRGKAKGHDNQKATTEAAPAAPADEEDESTPAAAPVPAAPALEPAGDGDGADASHGNGNGHGNGHGHGHDHDE